MTSLGPTSSSTSFTFIGTATSLLRLGPFNVLTDPNFLHRGQFAYLGKGLVSRRRTDPAMDVSELPPLDAIVLSHMHGDHWDRVARNRLSRHTPIFTTPAAARALRRQGFEQPIGLDTWDSRGLEKSGDALRITAMPGRHARGFARHLLPPVMGSMLDYESPAGQLALRLYITGDTLFVDDLRAIPERFAKPDVAVVHLGGTTLPGGLVVTMTGEEGAELMAFLQPNAAVPVHYDDYAVFKSPLSDFVAAMRKRGLVHLVREVARGETITF